jgi:hypothetical protein
MYVCIHTHRHECVYTYTHMNVCTHSCLCVYTDNDDEDSDYNDGENKSHYLLITMMRTMSRCVANVLQMSHCLRLSIINE